MFSVRILLVLSFAVGFSTSDDDDDVAYVKYNLPSVECTDIPDGSLCPLDYEIPDYTEDDKDDDGNPEKPAYNETEIRIRLNAVFSRLNSSGANQMCKDASRDFECSKMLPVCDDDDDYIRESGKKASEYCEEGKRKCASLSRVVLDEMFNCTSVGQETKTRARRGVCEDFPDVDDDPYPCAKRNYKVPSSLDFDDEVERLRETHTMLQEVENDIDEKCRTDVSEAVCNIVAPACTTDRMHVVDFLTKQECYQTMGCLSVTRNTKVINGTSRLCNNLADRATALQVALSRVYINKATTQGAASVILSFAFLIFTQFLI